MPNPDLWADVEGLENLPAFVVSMLARYEDGIKTAAVAAYRDRHGDDVGPAQAYAGAARAELVSLLDFLIGRLEPSD